MTDPDDAMMAELEAMGDFELLEQARTDTYAATGLMGDEREARATRALAALTVWKRRQGDADD